MLYVHIPFCKGKCIYCDFYSGGNPDWEKYLSAVASELSQRIDELRGDEIFTLYIGGGTPSLIPPLYFKKFFSIEDNGIFWDIIRKRGFSVSDELEFTIEVNPEDVNIQNLTVWKNSGVNRISMGVQSMINDELLFLKRRHTAEKVEFAMKLLKQYFNNISIDIMYGLPGQNIDSLNYTIKKVIEFEPTHISTYALTYEDKTPLSFLLKKGDVKERTEEEYEEFDNIIHSYLGNKGYERYEISNYSLPGFRSKHNSGYWKGRAYLGLGPSACSYNGINIRRSNPSDLKNYIKNFEHRDIKNIFFEEEMLSEEERIEEQIMLGLRTTEGIDLAKFKAAFGNVHLNRLKRNSVKWIKSKDIEVTPNAIRLTDKGIFISDLIITELSI